MEKIVIAIDGFSSCGKSTLAKQMAQSLNYIFVDSGAMYRAITLFFLREGIHWRVADEVERALPDIHLHFNFRKETAESEMFLNGENVERLIREMEVSDKVSEVAAIGTVRNFATEQQKEMGKGKGIIMDGRDIGTTVFPNAELKIFVKADMEIRTQRRYNELKKKQISVTEEEVRKNLENRDRIDSSRTISPLRQAPDARVLDNSHLTEKEQLDLALEWAMEKIQAQTSKTTVF